MNQNILNYYADTNGVETKYYLKDPFQIENHDMIFKYTPVGVCGSLQDEYGFFFNNVCCPAINYIHVPEGNTSPAQGTDDIGDTPSSDGLK